MLVETLLCDFLLVVVAGAEFEHKVPLVVGCDTNSHIDDVGLLVRFDDDTSSVLASYFVGTRVRGIVRVPADPALATVDVPLAL